MSEEQGRNADTEVAAITEDVSTTSASKPDTPTTENALSNDKDSVKVEDELENGIDADADSEAETLIQSPEKKRTSTGTSLPIGTNGATSSVVLSKTPSTDVQSRKRKRSINERPSDQQPNSPIRKSSPLSSPNAHMHSEDSDGGISSRKRSKNADRRVLKRNSVQGDSADSDTSRPDSRRASETHLQTQAHRRNKRSMDATERRETRSATYPRPSDDERSPSPQFTAKKDHKRRTSTQLGTTDFERKKRGRPPTISTRRHRSVERTGSPESDDDSPAPPRSALHKLAGQDNDTMSPAKTGPRKWRDKNGRTWVARAANNDDLEGVKSKLAERPQDLDLADNAGNSPLQIAALEGFVSIVEFLLSQGCDVDSRNIDKDTPLIDAVENGHLEVVRLLLDYGANPRLGNAKGDEPYELVPQDDENYTEIRNLLADAKERDSGKDRAQGQSEPIDCEGRSVSRAASAASPRDSPPVGPRSPPPPAASRRRTARSDLTRKDLLWTSNTQDNLTKMAGNGDTQGVARILEILQKAETESLIAAAKAGHNDILQLLMAMGDPNIDPEPLRTFNQGSNTPLLAAIGRGHIDVVKLLVNQPGFNPMRRVLGKTYFEYAEDRKGQEWQREYDVLKAAYDKYATSKGRKQSSPRKTRDSDKVRARANRRSSSPTAGNKRLSASSIAIHKILPIKSNEISPRDTRKASELAERKRINTSGSEAVDSSSIAVTSDLDQNAKNSKKGPRPRRSQSDLPTPRPLDNSAPHRRRRLVTGGEHRRTQGSAPGSASDNDSVDMIEVKQEDRPTPNLKRSRSSHSSDAKLVNGDEEVRKGNKKRRTIESSPEEMRTASIRLPSPAPTRRESPGVEMNGIEADQSLASTGMTENGVQSSNLTESLAPEIVPELLDSSKPLAIPEQDAEKSTDNEQAQEVAEPVLITDKQELTADPDPFISHDQDSANTGEQGNVAHSSQVLNIRSPQAESPHFVHESIETPAPANGTTKRSITTELPVSDNEHALKSSDLRQDAETETETPMDQAQIEAARQVELDDFAKHKAELEERQRELDDRLRREQEQKEQQQVADAERKRLEVIERAQTEALPQLLKRVRMLVNTNDIMVRDKTWLQTKFGTNWVISDAQLIDSEANPVGPKWLSNLDAACLLATKDLHLDAYPSLERRPFTEWHRKCVWRSSVWKLSCDHPLIRGTTAVHRGADGERERIESYEKFMSLPLTSLFWVKLTSFEDLIPHVPHLAAPGVMDGIKFIYFSLKDPSKPKKPSSKIHTQQSEFPLVNGIRPNGIINGDNPNELPEEGDSATR